MDSVAQAVVVAVTEKRGRPHYSALLLLGAAGLIMILGFQNCAVDLSSSTPGASSSGSCGSASAQALTDLQPVISGVLQTNCATCHGVTTGSIHSAFYTPDPTANAADTAIQSFTYTQLCARGGKAVGLKIDGSNSHGGGTFSRTGPQAPLFNYLDTHF